MLIALMVVGGILFLALTFVPKVELEPAPEGSIAAEYDAFVPKNTSEPAPKPNVAKYPGALGHRVSWTKIEAKGFEVGYDVEIWYPVKLDRSYVHPSNSEYVIRAYEGFDGKPAWGIPYCVVTSNKTVGFGGVKADMGIAPVILTTDAGRDVDRAGRGIVPARKFGASYKSTEAWRESGDSRMWTIGFNPDGSAESSYTIAMNGVLAEGEKWISCGYFVFVDAKHTPNKPNGVGSDWCMRIAVGNAMLADDYISQVIVKLIKDGNGNIVIGQKYTVVDRKSL